MLGWPAVLAALVVASVACRGSTSKVEPEAGPAASATARPAPSQASRELRVALHAPKTLDWTAGLDMDGTVLTANLYEGLRVMAPDGKGTVPGAAGEPEVSADGRTWTFRLRDDARWSDGSPVTAADFVAGWTTCLADGAACGVNEALPRLLAPPEGGYRALDDRTLEVRLARPWPLLPFALASTAFLPVPRSVQAAHPSDWMTPPAAVSNGPWRPGAYRPGVDAVLQPNVHHRAAATLPLDRVRLTFVQTQQNGDDLFRAGALDVLVGRVPIERVRELRAKADPQLVVWPTACTYFLALNTREGPTADPAFRRALAAAVDREKLALQVLGMGQQPAVGFVSPTLWAAAPAPATEAAFSPARAREAYRASTHAATPQAPVPYLLNEDAGNRLIAEAVQRDVHETLGVRLELQSVEWAAMLERLKQGAFSVSRMSWCAGAPDPSELVVGFRTGAPDNPSRYSSPEVDAALDRLAEAPTLEAREALVREIEAKLVADVAGIPLYHAARALLVRPCVKGLVPNAFDLMRFERVDLSACAAQGE